MSILEKLKQMEDCYKKIIEEEECEDLEEED
jgi:hypothetical protein